MKDQMISIGLFLIIVILIVGVSLFVGKTSFIDGKIHIERPWTAAFTLITMILAIFDK